LDASIERLVAVRRRDQKQRSGIWRDLAVRKRRTEVDAHFQPILAMANQHGLAAPLLRRVVEMIHEIENGQRPLALQNLDELRSLLNRS
jgi:2-dehydropantoate 2-reductase